MRILISNDDGIHAVGLIELVKALHGLGEIWVVAPDREQSAVGHSITLSEPIRLYPAKVEFADYAFAISGTPADCVKLAITELMPERPDIVISGINRGENTGISVIYSGTVSAATEGTINGIPSLAVSLDSFTSTDYLYAGKVARRFAEVAFTNGLPDGTLLNINVPALPPEQIKGVKVARQGRARFQETFIERDDPRGRRYYWMDGDKVAHAETDTDGAALKQGYISVTPIRLDLTHHAFIDEMKLWPFQLEELAAG
ncbi:5'/3'-nucleotidase SurE [bacterium]|nr:5'/3'-nucleotidase SurE [bacterium]MBU1638313.1 5'/3'-nucleotidase SurE [bacterium]MBU1919218.1 5'/3'-nucleotidase SurE [bacterium]